MKAIVRISFAAAALAGFMYAETSFAQDKVVVESDRVEYQKKTVIDFSNVNIEGDLTKPAMSYIKNNKKTRFRNLIELRGNFRLNCNAH